MQYLGLQPRRQDASRVDAAFADNLAAQARAAQAADDMAGASDAQRTRVEAIRQRIIASTEEERRSRPQPRTSEVRAVVEATIRSMQLRREDDRC